MCYIQEPGTYQEQGSEPAEAFFGRQPEHCDTGRMVIIASECPSLIFLLISIGKFYLINSC